VAGTATACFAGDPSTPEVPASSYRFRVADFRGRRAAGGTRRPVALARRLGLRCAFRVERRQSATTAIGIAAMPSAINPLETRSSDLISTATTTSPNRRPRPNVNRAILE